MSAYLSVADEHKNAEVRAFLKPFTKMAERYGVAIICITHLTKAGTTSAINRMIGSIAFAGAARSVWLVGRDKTNRERRLVLLAKCNIAADEGGLAFGIVDGAVAFEAEPVTQSADELLADEQDGEGPGRPADEGPAAESWLAMSWPTACPTRLRTFAASRRRRGLRPGGHWSGPGCASALNVSGTASAANSPGGCRRPPTILASILAKILYTRILARMARMGESPQKPLILPLESHTRQNHLCWREWRECGRHKQRRQPARGLPGGDELVQTPDGGWVEGGPEGGEV